MRSCCRLPIRLVRPGLQAPPRSMHLPSEDDAYPTCVKTALAEYDQLKARESFALLSQGRGGCT